MRDLQQFRIAGVVLVCLPFTGGDVAWADPARSDYYIENPYAAHHTSGSVVRIGSAVGFLDHEPVEVTAIGAAAAAGYRFDRISFEAEYTYLGFEVKGPDSTSLGAGHRVAVLARADVVRFGSRLVGANSMLSLYVEAGAGTAWNHWYKPGYGEASRVVPVDTKRPEGLLGFGVSLDHRLQEPVGFPHRVGWFLGWRVAMSPHQPMAASICRGVACRPIPMMDEQRFVDQSMLFGSSLAFTF